MKRDFTYIDDLISGIEALIDVVPERTSENSFVIKKNDSLSPVAIFEKILGILRPLLLILLSKL